MALSCAVYALQVKAELLVCFAAPDIMEAAWWLTACVPFSAPMALPQVSFDVKDPSFKLDDLLALELHKFEEEVGEIVDRAQKEEKMEIALKKLNDTWARVEFGFAQHKDYPVYTIKMAEEDFEVGTVIGKVALLLRAGCTSGGEGRGPRV